MASDELKELARQILADSEDSANEEFSMYFPRGVPDNFYYDAKGLRELSTVDSHVFRRLLGLER